MSDTDSGKLGGILRWLAQELVVLAAGGVVVEELRMEVRCEVHAYGDQR